MWNVVGSISPQEHAAAFPSWLHAVIFVKEDPAGGFIAFRNFLWATMACEAVKSVMHPDIGGSSDSTMTEDAPEFVCIGWRPCLFDRWVGLGSFARPEELLGPPLLIPF